MRFRPVNKFLGSTLLEVVSWLTTELNSAVRELYIGLTSISFEDNFNSFVWTGTLAVSETRQIPHPFARIPKGHLITKQVGNGLVDSSATAWDRQFAYLRNNSASNTVELTVIFLA